MEDRIKLADVLITLKTNTKIKKTLTEVEYEDETEQITELVTYHPDVSGFRGTLNASIHSLTDIEGTVFFETVSNEFTYVIHPSWIDTINGEKAIISTVYQTNNLVKLSEKEVLNIASKTVSNLADLDVCIECGSVRDIDGMDICSFCLDEGYFDVLRYSHTPEYRFHGEQKGKLESEHPTWYGIELEYGLPRKRDMAKIVYNSEGVKGDKALYLKSDSTIRGGEYTAELVTHPMSFDYLMKTNWIDELPTLEAEDQPGQNGCHIHVNRDAFKSDKAFNKFKFLILDNPKVAEAVGGRTACKFAPFSNDKDPRNSTKDKITGPKYSAINQTHKDTIECRFMDSTSNPTTLRRYIQFIDSMIKYCSYHSNTASFENYAKYVAKYNNKYSIINDFVKENTKLFTKGKVTIKPTVRKVTTLENFKIGDLATVTKVIVTNNDNETPVTRDVTDLSERNHPIRYDDSSRIYRVFGVEIYSNETVQLEYIA